MLKCLAKVKPKFSWDIMSKLFQTFQWHYSLHKPPLLYYFTLPSSVSLRKHLLFSGSSSAETLLWQKQLIHAPFCLKRVASKLTNVQRNSKTYWSLLNRFLNNKKMPLIPPFFHENKFVTDFKEKAELFNAFFAKQCSLTKNSSKIPSHLHYLTDNRLSS